MVSEGRLAEQIINQHRRLVVRAGDLLDHDATLLFELLGVEPWPCSEVGQEVRRLDQSIGPRDDPEDHVVLGRVGVETRTQSLGGRVHLSVRRIVLAALEDQVLEEVGGAVLLGPLHPRAGREGNRDGHRPRALDSDAKQGQAVRQLGDLDGGDSFPTLSGHDFPRRSPPSPTSSGPAICGGWASRI